MPMPPAAPATVDDTPGAIAASAPCWALSAAVDRIAVALAIGPLGSDDVRALGAAARALGAAGVERFIVDLGGVGPDGIRFAVGAALVGTLLDVAASAPTQIDVALPGGVVGAAVLGLHAMHPDASRWAVFCERRELVAAMPEAARSRLATLERHLAANAWHAQVRGLILTHPRLTARALAAELGWSERTLQRRLDERGSSFRAERCRIRLELALEALLAGNDKVGAIAAAVGFASESQFCHAFRRYTGLTPSEARLARPRPFEVS